MTCLFVDLGKQLAFGPAYYANQLSVRQEELSR